MEPVAIICSQDAELYLILEYILGVDGYKTELAGNVEEAAERTAQAIVMDCRPGGLPVATLCARLKQDPATHLYGAMIVKLAPGSFPHLLVRPLATISSSRPYPGARRRAQ